MRRFLIEMGAAIIFCALVGLAVYWLLGPPR